MDPSDGAASERTGGTNAKAARSSGMRSSVRAIALAVILVSSVTLAGCTGLTGGDSKDWKAGGTDVPSDIESKMDTPPSTVFSRVEEMLGVDVDEPTIVFSSQTIGDMESVNVASPLAGYMLGPLPNGEETSYTPNAVYDPDSNRIVVNENSFDGMDAETLEIELAAQFALAVHYQQEWWRPTAVEDRELPVRRGALRAIVTTYAQEHTNASYHETSLLYDEESMTDHEWITVGAQQHFAYLWVDERVDALDDIPSMYESGVPVTTEQLLHDTDEAPGRLSVDINTSIDWIGSTRYTEARYGELGIRELLRTRLDQSTADAAAEGWAWDQAERIDAVSNESMGMIWIQHWDSEADADEFESAMGSYLEQRRSESDDVAFDLRRVNPETTVVIAGNESVIASTEMRSENGTVSAVIGGGY